MDFQNVNPLNVKLNMLSGNLLPMTGDNSLFPVAWRIYSTIIWLIEIIQTSAIIPGMMLVPIDKAMKDGTVCLVITIEVFFLISRMHAHRDLVNQLIQTFNDILRAEDETMKIIVKSTLKPVEIPLKFYSMIGPGSIILWSCMPFVLIFEKTQFFYEDYRMPMVFSKEPFSTKIFLMGSFLIPISSVYIYIKKVALDVYMINLMLLMTAQYRYITVKLSRIFQERTSQDQHNVSQKKYYTNTDLLAMKEIKALCRHHRIVVQMTLMLKKLLSVNINVIYLINIFLFCFLDIMLIKAVLLKSLTEGFMIIMYISGGLIQLYIICLCVHQLLDASTEIADKAFHEKWYHFGLPLKRTLMMMILANNLECKLSTSEKLSLSLPSFMTILNQSYSFALLFLKIK